MTAVPAPSGRLARAVWLARAVMLYERSSGVWTPFLLAAMGIAAAAAWGLFERLPEGVGALVVGAALVLALVSAVVALLGVRPPTREEARARVELDSGLEHRPFAALDDAPAIGDPALWALHQTGAAAEAAKARVGRPKAGIAAADPWALRWAFGLALALALALHGRPAGDRALAALTPDFETVRFAAAPAARGPLQDPTARAVDAAARLIRSEWRPYAVLGSDPRPSWYGPQDELHRAPPGVQTAMGRLLTLDAEPVDPAARAGLAWSRRRLETARTLKEAKRVGAELEQIARRIDAGARADRVRTADAVRVDSTRG